MNMKEFFVRAAEDQALAEKLKKAADPDSAYAIAKEAGLSESFETFVDTMRKLNEAAGELSAADVEAITGGSISEEVTVTVLLGTTSVVTFAATSTTV